VGGEGSGGCSLADLEMEALKLWLVAQATAAAWADEVARRAMAVLKVVKVEKATWATAAAAGAAMAAPVEEWGPKTSEAMKSKAGEAMKSKAGNDQRLVRLNSDAKHRQHSRSVRYISYARHTMYIELLNTLVMLHTRTLSYT
jgi:hypothetical protein